MLTFRLIDENKTYIHLSAEGMDIPNAQCVILESDPKGKSPQEYIITFENGRKITVYLTQHIDDKSDFIFNKRGEEKTGTGTREVKYWTNQFRRER